MVREALAAAVVVVELLVQAALAQALLIKDLLAEPISMLALAVAAVGAVVHLLLV